ncbi:hypothetical protein [Dactylosporangium siamense]|uniref:Uncharacterized protein n=2 Tax=Dactylosporangium siamense TaxID=685454 RepID=A0A919UB84_9ACTN|nr:hypothetical protein [Dactylosporangium siamense]GIG49239.1 hypothetical protein Dsi01nite_072800 [Dactylosporangium siamense]
MDAAAIRSDAVLPSGVPATAELADVLVRFEERYGGLCYPGFGGNDMHHGLRGARFVDTPLGLGFDGIVDGDWTWGVEVLLDGGTVMDLGEWRCRRIDRSVDQRIEKHALLAEVRGWRHHQTFACRTPPDVLPMVDERWLPPPVPEATGPADLWWGDEDVAVQATLWSWPPEADRWIVRYFARVWEKAGDADRTVYAAMGHETVPARWCYLCDTSVAAGYKCIQ